MAKESTLTLTLKVDDQGTVVLDKFSKSIQKAGDDVSKMSKAMEVVSVSAFINIGQQAYAAMNRLYDFGKSIADTGFNIEKMARSFNMSTVEVQKWSYVANMAGTDIEGFGMGFKFLTRAMSEAEQGTGQAAKAFNALGLSVKDGSGKVKDQQTMMLEVIDTLGKYAEGANRDALMLAIFGRSWLSFKPLVDEGTQAIKDNMAQAEKLGLILGKDLTQALKDSEETYKKWEATWQASRTMFWTPFVEMITKALEAIMQLKREISSGDWSGIFGRLAKEMREGPKGMPYSSTGPGMGYGEITGVMAQTDVMKAFGITKPEAPSLAERLQPKSVGMGEGMWTGGGGYKMFGYEPIDQLVPGYAKIDDAVVKLKDLYEVEENIYKLDMEKFSKQADIERGMKSETDAIQAETTEFEKLYGITRAEFDDRMKMSQLMGEAWKEDYLKVTGLESVWKSFGDNVSSVWANNIDGMIKGTTKFGDAFKNMAKGISDTFISEVSKMIVKWLLFGSITGKQEEGGGFLTGGSWGGLLGSVSKIFSFFQEGGIVNRPTPAILGEGGPEAVIPLKGGKIPIEGGGGSTVIINNVYAMDVKTFEDQVNRNPGCIVNVLAKNVRAGGQMRDVIRGA